MSALKIPIDKFVVEVIHQRRIGKIISEWRLEEVVISNVIIAHFRSMGVFHCPLTHRKLLTDVIILQLHNSPQLARMVSAANRDEEAQKRAIMP